jgi:hypothetical protein
MIYSGMYSVVTSISVVGFYLSYGIPVYLGWRKKSRWIENRGPRHLGNLSSLINVLALVWTGFISIIMVMAPKHACGLGNPGGDGRVVRFASVERKAQGSSTVCG